MRGQIKQSTSLTLWKQEYQKPFVIGKHRAIIKGQEVEVTLCSPGAASDLWDAPRIRVKYRQSDSDNLGL